MQGKIQNKLVTAEIETNCSHCGQSLHITLDSDMNLSVMEQQASPLVFIPDVDWDHFKDPTIIDAY